MRSLIKDLKDEIEALQLEIDSTDENNNCNIEVSDKVFNTKTSGRGTAYNHKIRQVYYTLRSIGISVSKIDFVIRFVLSMVDIDIDFLPSKSTAANITSELGLVVIHLYQCYVRYNILVLFYGYKLYLVQKFLC
jgi:hypothetical protein